MKWKTAAGVLVGLALLVPAAPATAHTAAPGLDRDCRTVERKVFKDIRTLVTIDLDTASDDDVEVLATQILTEATAEELPVLPGELRERLKGTTEDLRAFLKKGMLSAWTTDLRVSVVRTLTGAGDNVAAATKDVLDRGAVDGYLAYLNEGLYAARELDCAAQPSPSPTVTPSATATAAPSPATPAVPGDTGGDGGGLPVTGAQTATVAAIGGALLLLGGAGFLIGRRRRSRFVA